MLLLAVLLVLAALLFAFAPRVPGWAPAALLLTTVAAIFAARLHHAGPYPFPRGPDLAFAALASVSGLLLLRPAWDRLDRAGRWLRRVLLGLSPFVFVLSAGAVLHEVEEVVVIRTRDPAGDVHDARLWVVDHAGRPWVVTGRATAHVQQMQANPRVELFRGGTVSCRIAELHGDRETIVAMLERRHRKYRVQRVAEAVGFWSGDLEGIEDTAVAIELAPCPDAPEGH